MFRKIILPIIAGIGVIFSIFMIYYTTKEKPIPPIPFQPPTPPYHNFIAGSGLVEASSENISIGAPFTALCLAVYVTPGDIVSAGTPLFKIDDRVLQAQLLETKAAKGVALANFQKLLGQPRPEEVPPFEARLKQAQVNFEDQSTQQSLFESVRDKQAISVNELNQRRFATDLAQYQVAEAQADLDLKLAGAWIRDLEISAMQIEEADKRVGVISTDIDRTTVRAPIDGQVLQVKIRPGEISQPPFQEDPMVLFGSIDPISIRVDIDEDDAWRMRAGAPATAFLRGNSKISATLQFERIEPYIIPKTSLTNETTERVDTRVLQVIYNFKREGQPIYLGQIMDVFIEAPPYRTQNEEF